MSRRAILPGWDTDVRRLANVLVHRIAVEQDGALVSRASMGFGRSGFSTLGARCAERLAKIRIRVEGTEIILKAPYATELFSIPSGAASTRRRVTTRITVRASMDGAKRTVLAALARAFPGLWWTAPRAFVLPKEGE